MRNILPPIRSNPTTLYKYICHMSRSVFHALKALKQWNIYHRDIMLSNILWCSDIKNFRTIENVNIKLCDFGLAKFQDEPPVRCGWTIRRPAQIIINRFHYCHCCDLYMFGLTIWEAWSGIELSSLDLSKEESKSFIYCGWKPPIKSFPQELQTLLEACWAHDPECSLDSLGSLLPK